MSNVNNYVHVVKSLVIIKLRCTNDKHLFLIILCRMTHYSYVNICMKIIVCLSWCVSVFARLCSVDVRPDYSCSLCVRVHVDGFMSPSPSNSTHWTSGLDWLGTGIIIQWKPRQIRGTLVIFGQPLNQQPVRTQQRSLWATQTQTRLLWQHL
jgi:hypothetical protein